MATAPLSAQEVEILVIFDGKQVSFSGTTSKNQIPVDQPLGSITLTLSPADGIEGAGFPSNPIQWVDGQGNPMAQPSNFAVSWDGPTTCTINDYNNSVSEPVSYGFYVLVQYNGQFFSSDPTIINQPPGDDPGPPYLRGN